MDEIRSFRDLKCWQAAVELRQLLRPLWKRFPVDEKYRLTDQLIRASRSVTANIAEGYGRFHYGENIQFCRQSRGSVTEIQDHLQAALEEEYITVHEYQLAETQAVKCLSLLNGYINYLKKARDTSQTDN